MEDIYCPPQILLDTRLTASARLLYGVIFTRAIATGYCNSTNQELGNAICRSIKRTSALISELVLAGYVRRVVVRDPKTNEVLERQLFPLVN